MNSEYAFSIYSIIYIWLIQKDFSISVLQIFIATRISWLFFLFFPPWRYDVFISYSGEEVRSTLIRHLRKRFINYGVRMFDDKKIRKGPIATFIQKIRQTKISFIVLSKDYASSRRCLDELLEILKCRKDRRHVAIPIFFGVSPRDIREQNGEFGIAFNEMCASQTEEKIQEWRDALSKVTDIVGMHTEKGVDPIMVERIERDVLRVLLKFPIGKSKSRCCTGVAILVVINLLLEIVSAVSDQLSFINKLYFARISLLMSTLSVVLSIIELTIKIRAHRARFRCKRLIPWFYYPLRRTKVLLGSLTDRILWSCAVGQFIVSAINCIFIEMGRDGPIKVPVMPLIFAIAMVGSKFMEEPTNSDDNSDDNSDENSDDNSDDGFESIV